jgi:hypothetical protein
MPDYAALMNPPQPATSETEVPPFDYAAHPRRVNLGCGFDHRDGYLNVDFQDFHHPDLLADVRDLSMLPSGYYEELIAQDVLEHLPRTEVLEALREWSRLLMPGGRLVLRVPDVIGLAKLLAKRHDLAEQEILLQNLYGTQAYSGDFHFFGFTEVVLRHYVALAGLEVAELRHRDEWLFDAIAVRVKGDVGPDLSDLSFMRMAADSQPEAAPVATGGGAARALRALEAARTCTDPGAVDLSGTRLAFAKRTLLRLLRLVTTRQAAHNRAVEEAIASLAEDR